MARVGEGLSDSARQCSDASDQTKSATEPLSYEIGQAGLEQASTAQCEMECKDHVANIGPGQDSASTLQSDQAKDDPDGNVCGDQKDPWAIIQALQAEKKSLKASQAKLKIENQSLTGILESYVNVETSPWKKNRSQISHSSLALDIARAIKRLIKHNCKNIGLLSGIEGLNICAHILPKHFAAGLEKLFGGKYKIHGTENLLLLQKDIEQAFDSGQFCFCLGVLVSGERCIKAKILDQSIAQMTIGDSEITFEDLEERFLDMTDHIVSGTLLSHHSKQAIHFAFVMKWIDSAEKESLLALAHFSSPDCVQAQQVSQWLKSCRDTQDGSLSFAPNPPRAF
jgi:hypothetical protein